MDENPIQPPIQTPSLPKPSLKLPVTILLVAILGVAGYAGASYYLNLWPFEVADPIPTFTLRPSSSLVPTPLNQLDDWKIYTKEWATYGIRYQVSYPPDWTSTTDEYFFSIQDKSGSIFTIETPPLGFGIDTMVNEEVILVDGHQAIKINFKGGNNRDRILVQFKEKSLENIQIQFNIQEGNDTEIFDRILATFKFIESTTGGFSKNGYTWDHSNSFSQLTFISPTGDERILIPDNIAKIIHESYSRQYLTSFVMPIDLNNPDLIYLSTAHPVDLQYSKTTNRIYSYNIVTKTLNKIFEIVDQNNSPMDNKSARILRSVASDGSKIILLSDDAENSPGPCTSIWYDYQDRLVHLDLNNVSIGLKTYNVSGAVVEQGRAEQIECQRSL